MTPDDEGKLLAGMASLYEALRATNMAVAALVDSVDRLKHEAGVTRERLLLLEVGQVFEEADSGQIPGPGRTH